MEVSAKRYLVSGRVQGVGYRNFVQQIAVQMKIAGYVRNLDDGRVEVYAIATAARHDDLAGYLRRGPRWADVRGVEECEAAMLQYEGFRVTR